MHFKLKMLEKNRKIIFSDKQNRKKIAQNSFDVKAGTQR